MAQSADGIRFRQFSPEEASFITPAAAQPITFGTTQSDSPIRLQTTGVAGTCHIELDTSQANISAWAHGDGTGVTLKASGPAGFVQLESSGAGGSITSSSTGATQIKSGVNAVTPETGADIQLLAAGEANTSGALLIGIDSIPSVADGEVVIKSGDEGVSDGNISIYSPVGDVLVRASSSSTNLESGVGISTWDAVAPAAGDILIHAGQGPASGGGTKDGNVRLVSTDADVITTATNGQINDTAYSYSGTIGTSWLLGANTLITLQAGSDINLSSTGGLIKIDSATSYVELESGTFVLLDAASYINIDAASYIELDATTHIVMTAETYIEIDTETGGYVHIDSGLYIEALADGYVHIKAGPEPIDEPHYVKLSADGLDGVVPPDREILLLNDRSGATGDDVAIRALSAHDIILQAKTPHAGYPTTDGGILLDTEGAVLSSGYLDYLPATFARRVVACTVDGFESHVGQHTVGADYPQIIQLAHSPSNCIIMDSTGVTMDPGGNDDHVRFSSVDGQVWWWLDRMPWDYELIGVAVKVDFTTNGYFKMELMKKDVNQDALLSVAYTASVQELTGNDRWLRAYYNGVSDVWENTGSATKPTFSTDSDWLQDAQRLSRSATSGQTFCYEGSHVICMTKLTNANVATIEQIVAFYKAKAAYP